MSPNLLLYLYAALSLAAWLFQSVLPQFLNYIRLSLSPTLIVTISVGDIGRYCNIVTYIRQFCHLVGPHIYLLLPKHNILEVSKKSFPKRDGKKFPSKAT